MDEEVNRDKAPRAEHPDSSSPPSLVLDGKTTGAVESPVSVSANNDLAMIDAEDAQIAQHMSITSSAALDVAGNNLDKKSEQAPFEKLPNELRHIIIGYIGVNKSLYNAVRVNKAWFDSLIDHIWYDAGVNALSSVCEEGGRRQFYASKIKDFGKDFYGYDLQTLRSVRLPSLHTLSLSNLEGCVDGALLCSLLTPTLRSIKLADCEFGRSELEAFGACTLLRKISLEYAKVPSMEGLIACLNQLQYLQIVEFKGEISTHDNSSDHRGELYPWLLQNSNLKEISLGTLYPMLLDHLTQVPQENDREVLAHRPNLNALGVHGPRQTILPLLSIATETLKRLDLAGNGPGDLPHDICNSLMQFPNLVELRLTLNDGYSMSTAEMGSISSLTRLKVLEMRSGRSGNNCMNLNWFTDDLFEIWICNLPNICELSLEWKCDALTERVIGSLGRSCPKLEKCRLLWTHDLNLWRTGLKTPLFPTLKRLELGEISPLIGSIPSSP